MLRPLKITLPPVTAAGGASSWAMANSRVDLPQPDSPTIAEELARVQLEAHPVDGEDRAAVHHVVDRQVADREDGPGLPAGPRRLGIGVSPHA